jgi:hypothetical protein
MAVAGIITPCLFGFKFPLRVACVTAQWEATALRFVCQRFPVSSVERTRTKLAKRGFRFTATEWCENSFLLHIDTRHSTRAHHGCGLPCWPWLQIHNVKGGGVLGCIGVLCPTSLTFPVVPSPHALPPRGLALCSVECPRNPHSRGTTGAFYTRFYGPS